MSRELLHVIDQISFQTGLDRETVLKALETALVSASRKRIGPEGDIRCRLNEAKASSRSSASRLLSRKPSILWWTSHWRKPG
jgi:hypothetical protein